LNPAQKLRHREMNAWNPLIKLFSLAA